jgi:hypothetical protein
MSCACTRLLAGLAPHCMPVSGVWCAWRLCVPWMWADARRVARQPRRLPRYAARVCLSDDGRREHRRTTPSQVPPIPYNARHTSFCKLLPIQVTPEMFPQ